MNNFTKNITSLLTILLFLSFNFNFNLDKQSGGYSPYSFNKFDKKRNVI